jgi:hypothetical protein
MRLIWWCLTPHLLLLLLLPVLLLLLLLLLLLCSGRFAFSICPADAKDSSKCFKLDR